MKKDSPKKIYARGILKVIIIAALIAVQIWWLVSGVMLLRAHLPWLEVVIEVATWAFVLFITQRNIAPEFKIFYVVLVAMFPVAGLVMYLLGGRKDATLRARRRFMKSDEKYGALLHQKEEVLEALQKSDPGEGGEAYYLSHYAYAPVYQDTVSQYFPRASDAFHAQLEDMKAAKSFIFMEYLTFQDSTCFRDMKEILKQKASEGVTVRIIYDDFGSVFMLKKSFRKEMESYGIACRVFNPIKPFLNIFMNNRDHRKIMVIDGSIGYLGGYNIADEYFNITHPYGYWKDTGVRLEGEAVRSLTSEFLSMWDAVSPSEGIEEKFLSKTPVPALSSAHEGYVQPFADNPLDDELVGREMYLNLLRSANDYCYICTPYLMITKELEDALISAAKRHVDVRLITPGIPDKKIAFNITRSYYPALLQKGVKIYEYTPGFPHAKICSADGRMAFVGSVNLDYRSLYHHFENGALFYQSHIVDEVTTDLKQMFSVSHAVTFEETQKVPFITKAFRFVLRLVAVLF